MYRPLKFSEVIGQNLAVKLLKNGLKNGKLPHSVILYGSSGIGKTTLARIISAFYFCLNKTGDDVCGKCDMCIGIQNGSIVDVLEFDAASHTSVEDIREILDLCNYMPQIGKEKIFIIDEAHMLSRNAISALLKTLEESPSNVRFILATTEIDKISTAIKSRCFCVPLQDMKHEDIKQSLILTANKDDIEIDEESIDLIIKVSYGSMREALSIFYRVTFLSKKITKDLLKEVLNFISNEDLLEIGELIINGKYLKLYDVLNKLIYIQNVNAIALIRQLILFFQEKYNAKEDQDKCVKIMIYLNRLHDDVLKTSMFNEVAIIYLCEISFKIFNDE